MRKLTELIQESLLVEVSSAINNETGHNGCSFEVDINDGNYGNMH